MPSEPTYIGPDGAILAGAGHPTLEAGTPITPLRPTDKCECGLVVAYGEFDHRRSPAHRIALAEAAAKAFAEGLLALWTEEGGECPHGRGFTDDCEGEDCERCNGTGKRTIMEATRGQIPVGEDECDECDGTGRWPCRHEELRPVLRRALAYAYPERPRVG